MQNRFIIILPTFNEIESIEIMISKIRELKYPFFIIDGGSTDGTVEKAEALGAEVFNRDGFSSGYGGGINKAIEIADKRGYEFIGFVDCDLTYPVEHFTSLFKAVLNNDLVAGSRSMKDIELVRRIGNLLHTMLFNVLYSRKIKDVNSGMRVLRISKFKGKINAKHFDFIPRLSCYAIKNNLTYVEVPINFNDRVGNSKLNFIRDGLMVVRVFITERFK